MAQDLKYLDCGNWDTINCPHRNSPVMKTTYINEGEPVEEPDSDTLEELNRLCGNCPDFVPEG
ncbi:MAG: hypothetical protein JRJ29_14265 [Deltaproteobacteria bacterium]|nr:hypothetical protein [Deltaproteobacteria bacterium]